MSVPRSSAGRESGVVLAGWGRLVYRARWTVLALSVLALERFSGPTKSVPYGYWMLRWFVIPKALD